MDRHDTRIPARSSRRHALQALGALGLGTLLAACGSGDTHDEPSLPRIIYTDADAGTRCTTRMALGQLLELRLRIDNPNSTTFYRQRGYSWPELRREQGPDRRVIGGVTYDVWYFRAVVKGRATLHMEITTPGSVESIRTVEYKMEVFEARTWATDPSRVC